MLLPFVSIAEARAQSKEQCIAAFDEAQELRAALRLRSAREKLLVCSREACANPLRRDCEHTLEEVTRDLPTIAIAARDDDGRDLSGVTAFIDEERLALDASGRSLALDPGPHLIRLEHTGYVTVSREVVLRMGERNRPFTLTLHRNALPVSHEREREPKGSASATSMSPLAYVFGGVGVLGLGTFTYFAIDGRSEKSRLAGLCAPRCSDAEVAAVSTRYLAADVALGVGVAALIAAAYLAFLPRSAR